VVFAGCSDNTDDGYYPPPALPPLAGTLEYHWSLNGRQVPEDCAASSAISFESVIVDRGFVIDTVQAPCEDFEASVPLYAGDFLSRAALTDVNGFTALRRIVEDIFDIEDGKVTTLRIDFPSRAVPMNPEADAGVPDTTDTPDAGLPGAPDLPGQPDAGDPSQADAGVDAGAP
jgi:hypothetical protein